MFLHGNYIGSEGAAAIGEALKLNGSLTSLDISLNSLSNNGAVAIAKGLKLNGSLTSLDVGGNSIGKEAALEFVSIFKEKQMTSVGLAGCSLGADGAKVVAEYVQFSGSLKEVRSASAHTRPSDLTARCVTHS